MITYCVENVVVWNKHIIIVFIKTIWHTSIIYQLENDILIRNIYKVLIKILCHNINRLCHNQKHTYTMLNKILCHTQIMNVILSKSETKKKTTSAKQSIMLHSMLFCRNRHSMKLTFTVLIKILFKICNAFPWVSFSKMTFLYSKILCHIPSQKSETWIETLCIHETFFQQFSFQE